MPVLSVLYAACDEPKHRLRLEEIYHAYCRRMLHVADGVLHDRHAAEDAVHDAFLGIARHMDTLSRLQEDEVRHYVLRAAQNAAISRLRRQKVDCRWRMPPRWRRRTSSPFCAPRTTGKRC